MKKAMLLLLNPLLLASTISFASTTNFKDEPTISLSTNPWFVLLGTGYAWSKKAGISNPNPARWDASAQGYDAKLGNSAFASLGVGKQLCRYLNIDLTYTNYVNDFDYQKFQTTPPNTIPSTPNFTGNARTRFFELDNQSLLVNATFHPGADQFALKLDRFSIFPFVDVGVGIGFNRVSDFHTIGYVQIPNSGPIPPTAFGIGSNTSIGTSDTTKSSFAWQGSVGLSVQPVSSYLILDVGYRYYDGGKFEGPDALVANTLGRQGSEGNTTPWEGRLKTDQVFINVRFLV